MLSVVLQDVQEVCHHHIKKGSTAKPKPHDIIHSLWNFTSTSQFVYLLSLALTMIITYYACCYVTFSPFARGGGCHAMVTH